MLSAQERLAALHQVIIPEATKNSVPQKRPVVLFVAGQPGAGKTRVADLFQAVLHYRGGCVRTAPLPRPVRGPLPQTAPHRPHARAGRLRPRLPRSGRPHPHRPDRRRTLRPALGEPAGRLRHRAGHAYRRPHSPGPRPAARRTPPRPREPLRAVALPPARSPLRRPQRRRHHRRPLERGRLAAGRPPRPHRPRRPVAQHHGPGPAAARRLPAPGPAPGPRPSPGPGLAHRGGLGLRRRLRVGTHRPARRRHRPARPGHPGQRAHRTPAHPRPPPARTPRPHRRPAHRRPRHPPAAARADRDGRLLPGQGRTRPRPTGPLTPRDAVRRRPRRPARPRRPPRPGPPRPPRRRLPHRPRRRPDPRLGRPPPPCRRRPVVAPRRHAPRRHRLHRRPHRSRRPRHHR
ncbi:zeta toxin family protein [Streptomyces sp. ISL-12]|nr:zeta toxin family protein [Streptomyces sp. ISL-12]